TKDGEKQLDPSRLEKLNDTVDSMADQALRVIAIGVRSIERNTPLEMLTLEQEITFIGLYGMIEPPRKEVKTAIAACRQARIKTVMITGDHMNTAKAIANELELLPETGRVVAGSELNQMSQPELENQIEDIYVFARVTPEHKLRIVNAFQS